MQQRWSRSSHPTTTGPMIPPPPSAEQGRAVPERRVLRGGGWCQRVGPLLRPPPPRCWLPIALSPTGSLPLSSRCPAPFSPATTPIGGSWRTAADMTRRPCASRTAMFAAEASWEETRLTRSQPPGRPAATPGLDLGATTPRRNPATRAHGTLDATQLDTYGGGGGRRMARGAITAWRSSTRVAAPASCGRPSTIRPV